MRVRKQKPRSFFSFMKQWLHGIGGVFTPCPPYCRGNAGFSQLIALEDRSLLSAAPLELEVVSSAVLAAQPIAPSEVAVAGPQPATASAAATSATLVAEASLLNASHQNQRTELVVVDPRVVEYQQIVNDIKNSTDPTRQFDVVVLESNQDGIEQITQLLAGYKNLDAVHLISHGTSDGVLFGNTSLNPNTLDAYADQFQEWRQALSSDADILFYGCNLAQTEAGQELLQSISDWTGADVAASTDNTGNATFGANWNLEYASGPIETTVALDQYAQARWQGLLATVTVSTTSDIVDGNTSSIASLLASQGADGTISLREAILATNNTPGADTIILPTGTYVLSIAGQGENAGATGDLDITDGLTILGAGSGLSIVDANGLDRVFHVQPGKSATISDVTLRGGVLPISDFGAGVLIENGATLNLSHVLIFGNIAGSGAGLYNYQGTLNATDTAFSNNTVINYGGGVYNDSGVMSLDRVTISSNTAGKDGGGALNTGVGSTFSMVNVTISGNTATDDGGGLWTNRAGTATNVTIAYNDASAGDGVYGQGSAGTISFKNSILYNPAGNNSNRAMTSLGYNIDSDGTALLGGAGDLVANPLLNALADNGGPTNTHSLIGGSPALDPVGLTGAPAQDQRGVSRDGTPDIGAFEGSIGGPVGPISDSNASADAVAENAANGTTVGITAMAIDPDGGDTVTYTLTNNAGGRFAINLTSGIVIANGSLLNYEAATSHNITVRATSTDGSLSTQVFTINILPVNDNAPLITSSGGGATAFINVDENTTAVTTVTATDADLPAQTLTYSILPGLDGAKFDIDSSTGILTFVTAPDFEAPTDIGLDNVYDVTVQVSDGTFTDTQNIAVTINPINESPPVITSDGGGATASINVAENTGAVTTVTATDADLPAQTLSFSIIAGVDADAFMIDVDTGILRFVVPPDFESPTDFGTNNVYDVIVQVSDGTITDTQTIAVTVTPVNDNAPVAGDDSYGVNEDNTLNVPVTGVLGNDTDIDGNPLTAVLVSGPSNAAAFSLNADGSFSYTPNANFNGSDSFTYKINDGLADSNIVTVNITVTPTISLNPNSQIIPFPGIGTSVVNPVAANEPNSPALVLFISPAFQNRIAAIDFSSAEQHSSFSFGGPIVAAADIGAGPDRNFVSGDGTLLRSSDSLHVDSVLFSRSSWLPYRLQDGIEAESFMGRSWNTLLTNELFATTPTASRSLGHDDGAAEMRGLAATGMVATAGYLLLNTRALSWILTLMLSQSAWQELDPLEVIYAAQNDLEKRKTKPARYWWQEVGLP